MSTALLKGFLSQDILDIQSVPRVREYLVCCLRVKKQDTFLVSLCNSAAVTCSLLYCWSLCS